MFVLQSFIWIATKKDITSITRSITPTDDQIGGSWIPMLFQ
jgi:hypothetical protein